MLHVARAGLSRLLHAVADRIAPSADLRPAWSLSETALPPRERGLSCGALKSGELVYRTSVEQSDDFREAAAVFGDNNFASAPYLHDGELYAALELFRSSSGYDVRAMRVVHQLGLEFSSRLSRIVEVHNRLSVTDQWGDTQESGRS